MPRGQYVRTGKKAHGTFTPQGYPAAKVGDNITDYDRLLSGLGLADDKVAAQHPAVQRWVRQNAQHKYVPEPILKALGVEVRDEARGLRGEA